MPSSPAHDPGHTAEPPPAGYTWKTYVDSLLETHGGWMPVANEFLNRARSTVDVPTDLHSIENALRRLAERESKTGGAVGKWVLEFFGLPSSVIDWTRWLGQQHSRFVDMPISLRREQLILWDRPPITESTASPWIDVGLAVVFLEQKDPDSARARLNLAMSSAKRAGTAALVETNLLAARMVHEEASENDGGEAAREMLEKVEHLLEKDDLGEIDRLCYRARLAERSASLLISSDDDTSNAELPRALSLYETIPKRSGVPFVDFRRDFGRARCRFRMGDRKVAEVLAQSALAHAGDGGLMRFRVQAMNLLAEIMGEPAAEPIRIRAKRVADQLEREDKLHRQSH